MNCQQFENFISDYLDETLSPSLRRQGAAHLMECQPCRTLLNDVRAVVRICGQARPVEPLTDLPARILQATAAGDMMSCSVFDELILDYFDGFITAAEFHIFEAHFDTCPRCQRLMRSIQLARDLCQEVKSVEVPEGLHERIIHVTSGADRRVGGQQPQGMLQRLTAELVRGRQRLGRSLLTPELVTAVLLCLATVGLLLVDFSDDMSVQGIYRHARWQIASMFHQDGRVAARKEKMASDLRQVKTQVSSVIETGIALFSKTPDVNQQVPSDPPADQPPRDDHSHKSTHEPAKSETMEKTPPSP